MITWILSGIAVLMIIRVFYNYVMKEIQFGEFFLWLVAWSGLLVLAVMPWISTFFAEYVGLTRGTDLVVILSIILLFYINYGLYKKVDENQKDLTKLVRALSKKK